MSALPHEPRSLGSLAVTLLVLACPARPLAAQDTVRADTAATAADSVARPARPDSAALVMRGDTLGWLYGSLGPFSPAERVEAASRRLAALRREDVDSSEVRILDEGDRPQIVAGSVTILSVTAADTLARGSSAAASQELAAMSRRGLQGAFLARNVRDVLLGLLWTVLTTAALYLLLATMSRWYPRLYHRIRDIQEDRLPSLRFQGLVLLTGERIEAALLVTARVSRLVLSALLLLIYFPLVFSFFPPTRTFAQRLFALALEPTRLAFAAVVAYMPNLFYIGVILVLTFYGLKVVHIIFIALGAGTIRLPGFYADWAEPTFKLLRVLVAAFAVILIWPYLPNSDSAAFRGVAAFLGLLLTFGSAGAVSNVVGGVVMIYMRPFQIGDRVRIADTMGDVIERGMLVTRVMTPKNVEITIPNSMVLGSHIVNYSATARETGVILHTTITIGYDAPWPEVQEAMKRAAQRTEGILQEPAPFVLQTALGDYAVSYELNAYTAEPNRMPALYSGLHQNLQDSLAEAGIEILSPIYHALRDGNLSTIPRPHTPDAKDAPAFRVRTPAD